MAFSSKNGIALCNIVAFNGISRNATNQLIGQTQGVGCSHEPILSDGPLPTKEAICLNVLDREPDNNIKYSNALPPGQLTTKSIVTTTDGSCVPSSKLPTGWYVFFGPEGPGYDGYQIAQFTGGGEGGGCYAATVTDCS